MSNKFTVRVHFINDEIKVVEAKDIKHVGNEGAKSGVALYDGREIPIYRRDEWNIWWEQYVPRSGECVICERYVSMLSPTGICEGCVLQAQIDAREQSG
jgi:hypothetical protein